MSFHSLRVGLHVISSICKMVLGTFSSLDKRLMLLLSNLCTVGLLCLVTSSNTLVTVNSQVLLFLEQGNRVHPFPEILDVERKTKIIGIFPWGNTLGWMRVELLELGQRLAIASHGARHGPSLPAGDALVWRR